MRPLPTLGGTHSFATGTNNRRQTVGWAETTVRDRSCVPPQVLQFRAGCRKTRPVTALAAGGWVPTRGRRDQPTRVVSPSAWGLSL